MDWGKKLKTLKGTGMKTGKGQTYGTAITDVNARGSALKKERRFVFYKMLSIFLNTNLQRDTDSCLTDAAERTNPKLYFKDDYRRKNRNIKLLSFKFLHIIWLFFSSLHTGLHFELKSEATLLGSVTYGPSGSSE